MALGFLSIAHLVGGIAVGSMLRRLRNGFTCHSLFLLVWGALFGGMPLFIGVGMFVLHGMPYLVGVEVLVFVGAIVAAALIPSWFLESFNSAETVSIAIGGLFMLTGIVVGVLRFKSDAGFALVFGGLFGGIGGLAFISGLTSLFKR
jgi:hypothetical protein